jgi:EAL and modified HD-GYP domain-containing signal transduction protein
MSRALELLPLSDEICEARLYRQGALGHALKCVIAYERGDWETTAPGNISDTQIRDRYLDSVVWTKAHAQGLSI